MHTQLVTINTAHAMGAAAIFSLCCAACDKPPEAKQEQLADNFFEVEKQTVPRVHRNQLGREPTGFLRRRATDPVHWQAWSPQLFEDAKAEQRLVFAVIGSGHHPNTFRFLDKLGKQPAVIDVLHNNYVCSLADLEVNPELGTLMATLSAEIQRPVTFPAMIWLSHEGNPVAWLPLRSNDIEEFEEVFGNANAMVDRIWKESPGYVVRNSRQDNKNRQKNSLPPLERKDEDGKIVSPPELDVVFWNSVRNLTSLYDPTSGTIDGSGGLLPSGFLNLSTLVALNPGTPDRLAERNRELLKGSCNGLLRGAIRDPLDGGVFSARRSPGWDLPVFIKATDTQAQMARAFARASVALDSPRFLEASRDILAYADRNFSQGGDGLGLYELTPSRTLESQVFLWPQEKLRELLTDLEFEVATTAFMTSGIGNIAPESDPKRDFFRKNSLGMKRDPIEIAATLGITEEAAADTLKTVCRRLLAERQELLTRVEGSFLEETRVTETNARIISALATHSHLSGDPAHLARANALLAYLKSRHYSEQGGLLRIATAEGSRKIRARGADYAALLDALFTVYRLDLDPAHLGWARALADELLETHGSPQGRMLEVSVAEQIGLLEIYSISMIFGDSTWGSVYGPLERLHQLTGSDAYREAADLLRDYLLRFMVGGGGSVEMIHTDFLSQAMIPLADTVVYLGGEPGTPEFTALHQLLLNPAFHAVTILHQGGSLPPGIKAPVPPVSGTSARVISGDQPVGEAETPGELERLLRKALSIE